MSSFGAAGTGRLNTHVRHRVLFVAENVTTAQVVRLVKLAESLPEELYEVHFACADFPKHIFGKLPFTLHEIASLAPERANAALKAGKRLYTERDLRAYIEAEKALISKLKPALVVGDFRWSLSTSAELCGVACGVLINAYWSPYRAANTFPVPDHPILKWVSERRAAEHFPKAMPYVFRHFAAPLNAVRTRYGLPQVGSLLEVLCHGDYTLYPDVPQLTPVSGAPSSHRFLGPVLWEPQVIDPELRFPDEARPFVYVTLGSSGEVQLLPALVKALAALEVNAVVATAGRIELRGLPANVIATPFVSGSAMARRAQLVISNGGSTTGYQALNEGTPVLGIPHNFDQYLASQAIVAAGAGAEVKARSATFETLRQAISDALGASQLKAGALEIARHFAAADSASAFQRWVAEAVQAHTPAQRK